MELAEIPILRMITVASIIHMSQPLIQTLVRLKRRNNIVHHIQLSMLNGLIIHLMELEGTDIYGMNIM
jgi:hypothetical protein